MNRLFCYGTLQVPDVIKAVTGRTYPSSEAKLDGYAIYKVKNAEYPGIVPTSNSKVADMVCEDVTDDELKVLDLFEGDLYDRQLRQVELEDGNTRRAWVYVIKDEHQNVLTDIPWRLKDFLDEGIASFMTGYVQARRDIYAKK